MLDGFLKHTLDLTVIVAYLPVKPPHLSDIDLADQEEEGKNSHRNNSQQMIHGKEIKEGT